MSAAELLDQLHRAGATLEMVDGTPRIRGAKISPDLMAQLKANRDALIAELEKRLAEDKHRFGRVPEADAPMLARDFAAKAEQREQIRDYVLRQGRSIHAWVMRRANEYHGLGVPLDDCEWMGCLDLIAWQRHTDARGAVLFVSGLDECAKTIPEKKQ